MGNLKELNKEIAVMMDYEKIVKELRTKEIPQECFGTGWVTLICDAADAIDELTSLINKEEMVICTKRI